MKKLLAVCAGMTLATLAIGAIVKRNIDSKDDVDYIDDDFEFDPDWENKGIEVDEEYSYLTNEEHQKEHREQATKKGLKDVKKFKSMRRRTAWRGRVGTIIFAIDKAKDQCSAFKCNICADIIDFRTSIKQNAYVVREKLKAISNDILPGDFDWKGAYSGWLPGGSSTMTFKEILGDIDTQGLFEGDDPTHHINNEGNMSEDNTQNQCSFDCDNCDFCADCGSNILKPSTSETDCDYEEFSEPDEE